MSRRSRGFGLYALAVGVLLVAPRAIQADAFREKVVPFVKTYCVECHDSKKKEAHLDLSKYATAEMVAADYRQWEHVLTFVMREEMPPPDAKQPAPAERAEALKVLEALLLNEARRTAGDPGVVLPRRLSNAEYNNAIRDLTGVEIRPADAFPVDPASGEGFSNTGEALVMSPSLFKKYYAAAQHVADHVLLTPTELSFAPHPVVTFADQKKLTEQAILSFYERHSIDYSKYLTALWSFRYRDASQQAVTIDEWARKSQLSPKYLQALWAVLDDKQSSDGFYLNWLRSRFEALPKPLNGRATGEATAAIRALADDIKKLSKQLCMPETEAIVSNAGNGPVQHIDRRKKTAASRDAFNPAVVSDAPRRLHAEFNPQGDEPVVLTLRIDDWRMGTLARPTSAAALLKNINFSSNGPQSYRPNDKDKNVSLKSLLTEHAPNELSRLNWGPHAVLKVGDADSVVFEGAASVTVTIPTKALAEKKLKHLYLDASFVRQETQAAGVRVSIALGVGGANAVSPLAPLGRGAGGEGPANGDSAAKNPSPLTPLPSGARGTEFRLVSEFLPSSDQTASAAVLINPQHAIVKDIAASGEAFCKLFPNRFYFSDDTRGLSAGFHLIEGFFRDDQPLSKLILDDEQQRELDRLWDELNFVTGIPEKELRGFVFFERSERNFMKHADFNSIKEEDPELTSDATMLRFEQIYLKRSGVKHEPIAQWVESINAGRPGEIPDAIKTHEVHHFFDEIRQALKRRAAQWPAAAPIYLKRLQQFAHAAYRRPLTDSEQQKLTAFFNDASKPEALGIEQAVRATVTRILVSPHFCYLADPAPAGTTVKPLPDLALASRLSFFLWSSTPDAELRAIAEAGKLNNPETLKQQTQRMLRDPKVSGFALDFFGQWLNYRDFKQTEAVNRTAFPAFDDALKQAMFEEPTRLTSHVLQQNLPLTELLRSDTTLVNKRLAQHYSLPFDAAAGEWQLATGLHQQGRSGLLGMAVFLTKNSQPQRTSPVKRGFWVVHKLLGEHIPPPPPDVAVLPAKETDTNGKTIRELLALHTEDNKCARCHVRFDPIGLAMEGFDSIGRARSKDLAGRAIDNRVKLPSGEEARGVAEFSQYLAKERQRDFTRTLSRKLLGYSLGRSLQLSDLVLLEQMESALQSNNNRAQPLFEAITTSPAFRQQRCREFDSAAFEKSVSTASRER